MSAPITTRMKGVIRLFSNEYFTMKTTPRKRTKPPIQAKSFTPRNASQSIAGFGAEAGRGFNGGGVTEGDGIGGASVGVFKIDASAGETRADGGAPGTGTTTGSGRGGGTTSEAALVSVSMGATAGAAVVAVPLDLNSSSAIRATSFRTVSSSALILRAWAKIKTNGTSSAKRTTTAKQVRNGSIYFWITGPGVLS